MLNGCANQHNPGACQSYDRIEMPLFVLTLNRSGTEEVVKQRGCPGTALHYEGNVADCFKHASLRPTCRSMIVSEQSARSAQILQGGSSGGFWPE